MIGFGYDLHRLAPGESLVLGGIRIESDFGTVAHSDGDVLLHSISDAILGAAGMGDIGEHFPDTDDNYKDADSGELLKQVSKLVNRNGYKILNIDATIVLEKPKLHGYKSLIKENIANLLSIEKKFVNVKATTNEKTGVIGAGEAVAVYSVCQLELH